MNTSKGPIWLAVGASVMAVLAGCAGDSYPKDVTGSTGTCWESNTLWSGEPLGGALPGTILERDVTCPEVVMTDERLSGSYEDSFRCEFAAEGEGFVGQCTENSTRTIDNGAWHVEAGTMVITVIPGQASRIVEDGVEIGTGDYAGLMFRYHVDASGAYPWEITGTLERSG